MFREGILRIGIVVMRMSGSCRQDFWNTRFGWLEFVEFEVHWV